MLPRPGCLSATARAACPAPAAVHTRIQAPEPGAHPTPPDVDRQVNGPGKAVDGAARSESRRMESVAKKVAFCEDDVTSRVMSLARGASLRLADAEFLAIAKEPGTQSWLGRILRRCRE